MNVNKDEIWKYVYWLDDNSLAELQKQMKAKGTDMVCAQHSPFETMRGDIGYAEPHIWPVLCKPDATPWYTQSKYRGKHLVVSSFPLDKEYDQFLETTINPVSFEPFDFPPEDEKEAMAQDELYLSCEPEEWRNFPEEWAEELQKGFARRTDNPPKSFDELRNRWAAVHSNFANPKYRADETFLNAPYSIAESVYISTCCVELFNLINSQEAALLVRPCIGAVYAEVMENDRYYLVRLVKNRR